MGGFLKSALWLGILCELTVYPQSLIIEICIRLNLAAFIGNSGDIGEIEGAGRYACGIRGEIGLELSGSCTP